MFSSRAPQRAIAPQYKRAVRARGRAPRPRMGRLPPDSPREATTYSLQPTGFSVPLRARWEPRSGDFAHARAQGAVTVARARRGVCSVRGSPIGSEVRCPSTRRLGGTAWERPPRGWGGHRPSSLREEEGGPHVRWAHGRAAVLMLQGLCAVTGLARGMSRSPRPLTNAAIGWRGRAPPLLGSFGCASGRACVRVRRLACVSGAWGRLEGSCVL